MKSSDLMRLLSAAQLLYPVHNNRLPLTIKKLSDGVIDLLDLASDCREELAAFLLTHGALLFRGFKIKDAATFGRFLDAISDQRLDYIYRSTPRETVGDRIFSSTVYPSALEIPLHQENAYQREWPMKLALCCVVPASVGGETPLADVRKVTARLSGVLLDRFEERGVRYLRHYHEGTDLPWQTVFQTEDREVLASYCESHGIEHEWIDHKTLRTTQRCQGVAYHPVTKERLFFNQAHLFHVSNLGDVGAQAMVEVFGADQLPRNTTYGDGTVIDASDLQAIRNAFVAEATVFPWEAGDVVVIDNMQVAHGRRAFKGKREVLAAMSDPYAETPHVLFPNRRANGVEAPEGASYA